jgi:hypothetical protein
MFNDREKKYKEDWENCIIKSFVAVLFTKYN